MRRTPAKRHASSVFAMPSTFTEQARDRIPGHRQRQEAGECEHTVDSLRRLEQIRQAKDVATNALDPRIAAEMRYRRRRPKRIVVEQPHLFGAIGQQSIGNVRADQAGTTGDDIDPSALACAHACLLLCVRGRPPFARVACSRSACEASEYRTRHQPGAAKIVAVEEAPDQFARREEARNCAVAGVEHRGADCRCAGRQR